MANELAQILKNVKSAQKENRSQSQLDDMANTINALNNQNVAQFSVLNEMTQSVISNIEGSIPGRDALIAAFSAGNPLVAGGLQLVRDMASYRKQAKNRAQQSYDEQVKVIQDEFGKLKPEKEESQREQPSVTEDPNQGIEQALKPLDKLEPIREQLDDLNGIQYTQLKVLNDIYKEWSGVPHEMVSLLDDQLKEQEKLRKLDEQKAADDKLRGENEPKQIPTSTPGNDVPDTKRNDMSPLQAMFVGLNGLLAGASKILGPMKSVTKLFKVGPLALLSAAWDFGSGFMDASKILQKDNVGISDRIIAGASEIIGGFADVIDFGANLFGMDTNFGQAAREKYLQFMELPLTYFNKVEEVVSNIFNGINMNTKLVDMPGMIWDNITDMYHNALAKIISYDPVGKVTERATKIADNISESVGGVVDSIESSITGYMKGISETTSEFFTELWDSSLDRMIKMIKDVPFIGDNMANKLEQMKVVPTQETQHLDPVKAEEARRKIIEAKEREDRYTAAFRQQDMEVQQKQLATILNQTNITNNKSLTTVVKGVKQSSNNQDSRNWDFGV